MATEQPNSQSSQDRWPKWIRIFFSVLGALWLLLEPLPTFYARVGIFSALGLWGYISLFAVSLCITIAINELLQNRASFVSLIFVGIAGVVIGGGLVYTFLATGEVVQVRENVVPFMSTTNILELNPEFNWEDGGYNSSYDIGSVPLIIRAGSGTSQYENRSKAPLMLYPVEGDFEASVNIAFDPTQKYQVAGLGVKASDSSVDWVRVAHVFDDNQEGIVFSSNQSGKFQYHNQVSYSQSGVFLKIIRRGSQYEAYFSENGNDWQSLSTTNINFPDKVQIFLVVFSDGNGRNISARFEDLKIIKR